MDPLSMALAGAYALDLGAGDPRWLPHPVRGLGWLIARGETWWRARVREELLAGMGLVAAVVLITFGLVVGLLWAAAQVSVGARWGLELLLIYACLSTRDLAVESWPVFRALKKGDLPLARQKLSLIVGRDTAHLDEAEVVRACLETLAESVMDGIVSPLFYAGLGGAPLACVYKAVNTLDSMVGYRSSRYIRFGRAAAKVDAWANWLPARLTAWLIAISAGAVGFSASQGLKVAYRDAWARGENSWIPEAALGGALGVRLGGGNTYQGRRWETPFLGDDLRPLAPDRIAEAIRVMYASSLLALAVVLVVRLGFFQVWGY